MDKWILRKREEDDNGKKIRKSKGRCQIWELITCMIIMKLQIVGNNNQFEFENLFTQCIKDQLLVAPFVEAKTI